MAEIDVLRKANALGRISELIDEVGDLIDDPAHYEQVVSQLARIYGIIDGTEGLSIVYRPPLLAEYGIKDSDLLGRAVRSCKPRLGKDRWSVVMDVFALGSSAARALCQAFGLDPDERRPSRRRSA